MTPHNEAEYGSIAKTVIMPGDPLRAEYIATNYLTDVKLVNKVRNIFAYTGFYKNKEITIMASGMGMPSIGIYSYELYKFYDVDNIIRIGSAGSYTESLNLLDVVVVTESYSESNYALVQGYNSEIIQSSEKITSKIKECARELNKEVVEGRVHSTDIFYRNINISDMYNKKKCLCVEMESFALFYNAKKLNKNASCILTISDNLITNKKSTIEERQTAFNDMIVLALEAAISL